MLTSRRLAHHWRKKRQWGRVEITSQGVISVTKEQRNIAETITKTSGGAAMFNINSEFGVAAAIEAKRLAEKYGKDFLGCDDLVRIMGVGKNNVRQLMGNHSFPTVEIGNRKVVSIIAFTIWAMQNSSYR